MVKRKLDSESEEEPASDEDFAVSEGELNCHC